MPQTNDSGPPRYEDYLLAFENGMDSGTDPFLLDPNTLAFCTNGTVRGNFLQNRPVYRTLNLVFSTPAVQQAFQTGLWQGACYCKPDPPTPEILAVSISGRLFIISPDGGNTGTVVEATIPGDPQSATALQAFLWQSEMFVIWNDGLNNPVFYNSATGVSVRSNYSAPVKFNTSLNIATTVTAIGNTTGTPAQGVRFLNNAANMAVGDILTFRGFGNWIVTVLNIDGANGIQMANLSATPFGAVMAVGVVVTWQHQGTQLPPGRMGAYILGRNWMSLIDGKQFIASDIVGGSSGTQANNYRDAPLSITENLFLFGGGNFSVPGPVGSIRGIIGLPTLDASLGQGPVFIVTPKAAYSCQAPVDRTTWSQVTNPILTATMLVNAGQGQNSTFAANSDILMRSVEGIRSLKLTRNDFQSWGNTTISNELLRILPKDQQNLLIYGSGMVFDNRGIITAGPIATPQGVYHKGLVAINFDLISTLRVKENPVWESLWLNMNTLQLVIGDFGQTERGFAFHLNTTSNIIQLREILADGATAVSGIIYDDNVTPISTIAESAVLFKDPDPKKRIFKRLFNGEIYVDELVGDVHFDTYWKPDQWPAWIPWNSFDECQQAPTGTPGTANYQPGFRPRLGLGEPSSTWVDNCNDRPLREGFTFQFRIVITGACRFKGARFEALGIPLPVFAKPGNDPICSA